ADSRSLSTPIADIQGADSIRRMRGARETLPWFLLVPYFAVFSLNVMPWLGEERRSANRTNAQLALALVFASIALPLLKAVGVTGGSIVRTHPWWLGLGLI